MKKVEIEIRTFISPIQYKKLERQLKEIANFFKEIDEETIYFDFDGDQSLRLRRDQNFSYLILKSGKIHDDFREEIKIQSKRGDFGKLKDLLKGLGFNPAIKWLRKRKVYNWQDIKVFLDDTEGYGKIVELEKFGNEENKEKIFNELKNKLFSLGIKKITSKKEFNRKFNYYKRNWQKLIGG